MFQFLNEWLRMRAGAAPVMTVTGKHDYPMIMHAFDEAGIILSDRKAPEVKRAYPWSAIIAAQPDRSE